MTATNHALTGALIGALLPLPIAIPLAFASHFVLDSLPHYGIPAKMRQNSKSFQFILIADIVVALTIALAAALYHKWDMELVGWIAYSPDITWVIRFLKETKKLPVKPMNWFMRFHSNIQKYERPWGIAVDLVVFAVLLPLFIRQLVR